MGDSSMHTVSSFDDEMQQLSSTLARMGASSNGRWPPPSMPWSSAIRRPPDGW